MSMCFRCFRLQRGPRHGCGCGLILRMQSAIIHLPLCRIKRKIDNDCLLPRVANNGALVFVYGYGFKNVRQSKLNQWDRVTLRAGSLVVRDKGVGGGDPELIEPKDWFITCDRVDGV